MSNYIMNRHITIILLVASLNGLSQGDQMEVALDSACTCLTNAANAPEENTKFDFEYKFGVCLESLFSRVQQIDSSYVDRIKLNQLIHKELKESCEQFILIDSIHQFYSTHTFEIIATKEDCEILKSGTFVTYGDADSTLIIMTKNSQILKFKSGAYTKSKVKWIDDCTYELIRIESTDPFEKQIPPGDVRMVKIIHVSQDGTIFYEIIVNNKSYSGRLMKVSN